MDRVALDLGIIQIYWYSIFIFLGILAAAVVIGKEAKKQGLDQAQLENMAFFSIIFGLIGARIYYVLFNLPQYLENPIEILQVWNGGLAIHGGLIAGALTVLIICKKHQINKLKMLDIIVVGLILGQAIGRWGNFFNSEAYGMITTAKELTAAGIPKFVIDGMYINGAYHQPTFFYESMWNLFGFFALILIRKHPYLKEGQLTGIYLIWYSTARFIIEGLRTDSLMLGNFKVAQIVSIILLVIGIIILFYYQVIKRTSRFEHLYKKENISTKKEEPSLIHYVKNKAKKYN